VLEFLLLVLSDRFLLGFSYGFWSVSSSLIFFVESKGSFFSFLIRFSSCTLRFHRAGVRLDHHHRSSRAQLTSQVFWSLSGSSLGTLSLLPSSFRPRATELVLSAPSPVEVHRVLPSISTQYRTRSSGSVWESCLVRQGRFCSVLSQARPDLVRLPIFVLLFCVSISNLMPGLVISHFFGSCSRSLLAAVRVFFSGKGALDSLFVLAAVCVSQLCVDHCR
jgi:hypothetical protein